MSDSSPSGRRRRGVAVVVGALALLAAPAVGATDHDHDHPVAGAGLAGRVGVLLADHGEPPLYNEWTYESFREFFAHLIAMGVVPSSLAALETGTILYDADCPACPEARESPRLVDAWLRPHEGPAAFVPASDSLAAHYVLPGGPGFREPDIYEHVGLSAWHEWQRMGGRSPNYDEKLAKKSAVMERLRARYGDGIAIRVGYGIDPRIDGGRQGIREALDALVNRDRIESLVVVYHGVGFSDIMQTHHLRHQIGAHLEMLGAGDIPIRYSDPLGTTDHYVRAIVDKVGAELASLPPDAAVAIHLSGHGLPTTTCGEYDCGADAYHRYARELFARMKPAVEAAVDRPGRTGVFHVYGDGGDGESDPGNEVASPLEALDARVRDGFTHVVDVPYEFDSNSRDTLIVLRQGYDRPQPDWNAAFESQFAHRGLQVKIANASGGEAHKTAALEAVTLAALGGRDAPATPAAAPSAHHGGGTHTAAAPVHAVHATSAAAVHDGAHVVSTAGDHDVVGSHGVHEHAGGGVNGSVGVALAVVGGGALVLVAVTRRRSVVGRIVGAGVGVQLVGLGWDVVAHARSGEAVHLLENAGHWTALVGLIATGAVGGALLSRPPAEHA